MAKVSQFIRFFTTDANDVSSRAFLRLDMVRIGRSIRLPLSIFKNEPESFY
jgi:hypothetical protein